MKTMEAICFIHDNNVYYGDMKPENILVFRNYKVKLGDFGVSIKIPDDKIKKDSLIRLKGLTTEFCMPSLIEKYYNHEDATVEELY